MEDEKSNILQVIGSNIKRARLLRGLTQEALSEELNTSTNFISLIERGASGVSLVNLVDICNILEVNPTFLFEGLFAPTTDKVDLCNILKVDISFIFDGLIAPTNNNDNLINSISLLSGEDRAIVDNLVNYIIKSKK